MPFSERLIALIASIERGGDVGEELIERLRAGYDRATIMIVAGSVCQRS